MRAVHLAAAVLLCACSVEPRATRAVTAELARADDPAVAWIDEGDSFRADGVDRVPLLHAAGAELLAARAPRHADGPIVLSRPGGTIELRAIGARAVQGSIVGDAIVYANAWPSVDLVLIARRGSVEDVRVVRAKEGLASLRTSIAGMPARLSHGDVVVGNVFRAAAPTAIDARGAKVRVDATLEGSILSLSVGEGAFPIVVDPAWTSAASLATPRDFTTGSPLPDGKVLAAGGTSNGIDKLSTTEIYDPTAASWTFGAPLSHARRAHGAAVTGGKVLVVGGEGVSIAELYDPSTSTWTDAGTSAVRAEPALVTLPSGDVLAIGGRDTSPLSTVEIWSATTHTFRTTASMSTPRVQHTATLLKDGRVLVAGGKNGAISMSSAEMFDPKTETWAAVAAMTTRRHGHSAHRLEADGSVLVVGGLVDAAENGLATSETFSPDTGTWVLTPDTMNRTRGRFASMSLAGDRVIVAGGFDAGVYRGVASLFDGASTSWSSPEDIGAGLATGGHQRSAGAPLGPYGALFFGGQQPSGPTDSADTFALRKAGADCTPIAGGERVCEHVCVDLHCCDTKCDDACSSCALDGKVGTCSKVPDGKPVPPRSCAGAYAVCVSGACATSCTKDEDCKSSSYCEAGSCVRRRDLGSACTSSSQCGSRICADGYCCEASCANACEACNEHGACAPVAAGKAPPHDVNACNGYVCSGAGCRTTCTTDEDCVSSHRCRAGSCTPRAARECSEDRLSSIDTATGAAVSCLAYRCAPSGACLDRCAGSGDCAPAHTCDLERAACVPSDETQTGGCAMGRGSERASWLSLALIALAMRRRR